MCPNTWGEWLGVVQFRSPSEVGERVYYLALMERAAPFHLWLVP